MIYQDSTMVLEVRGLHATVNGIEILKVREIIGMMNITRVPRTPARQARAIAPCRAV